MEEFRVLEELGLSDTEASVYLTLLETGTTVAGPVIKKTGLHRSTTYQTLQRLQQKGLVSSIIKGKKQHFQAANPDTLLDDLEEREERLKSILPTLHAKQAASKEQQEVTVYYGAKGIRTVMDNMLEELTPNGTYVDFGSSGLFKDVMGPYFDVWQRKKKKHNIRPRVVFTEDITKTHPEVLQQYYGEARLSASFSITDTMVYNDTVILFIWTAKPPVAIVIKNRDNAKSYLSQFELLWQNATTC